MKSSPGLLYQALVGGFLLCASLPGVIFADDPPMEGIMTYGEKDDVIASYQGITYDEQNPGDHLMGPSGENAIGQTGTNGNEALDECSAEQINLTHQACISSATIEHYGSNCAEPEELTLGVQGTIDIGFIEFDVSFSVGNNPNCDGATMALTSATAKCDLEKAQKELDCAAQ